MEGAGRAQAIRQAFQDATTDIVVFIDADGSHDPKDIPALVAPIAAGTADLVIGSRGKGGSDELHGTLGQFIRYVGSQLIMLAINYRWDVRLSDSQNGFRAIRRDVGKALDLRSNLTTIEQEMLMRALKRGYRVIRDCKPRVRAPLGHVQGGRLEIVVGVSVVVLAQYLLTPAASCR